LMPPKMIDVVCENHIAIDETRATINILLPGRSVEMETASQISNAAIMASPLYCFTSTQYCTSLSENTTSAIAPTAGPGGSTLHDSAAKIASSVIPQKSACARRAYSFAPKCTAIRRSIHKNTGGAAWS